MRVLFAEDDLTTRLFLEAQLKKWGFDVETVHDGNEAWACLETEDAPPLVLLDWLMPGMDGLEVCRRLKGKEASRPTYAILLTSRDDKDDIIEGLEAGADDYITKPFSDGELRARINVGCRVLELQNTLSARVEELQNALSHIKTLQGILPICMHCHKIRADRESWERIESYIEQHSDAQFSHGICPECLKEHYRKDHPDLVAELENQS